MSTLPDNELDLEKLFLPAWAQEEPSAAKYAKYEGEVERPERRGERRGPRPPRREGGPRGRREGNRPGGERRGFADRQSELGGAAQGERGGHRGERRGPRRNEPRARREPPPPLPEVDVALIPEEKGVESLARQIKMSGRAYPLFDIAQMILQKPERHLFVFSIKKNPEGQPIQPLVVCALDETLWLSDDEAVAHVLKKHFGTFYQAERTPTEPPKGKYTFVAQCGLSGVILGPPNYHDYQNQLRKLHAERFSRMPLEVYKSRVKIVRDEEVVKKWVEDQSWKTEYVCLNMPEAVRLASLEAVEKHFRENHKDNIIKRVETHTANGTAARAYRSPELSRLVRSVWEDQRRFPLQIATVLSQQFASHGLQFFKVNKTITHVSVARPHYLDLDLIPVSDGVKRIVQYISANPKCNRRQMIETLAPTPAPEPLAPPAEAQPPAAAEAAAAPATGPTPEQTAIIADLHWLIHQGHVIEFANGILETAKKPAPKPPKPETKPAEKPAEPNAAAESATPGATIENQTGTPSVPAEEPSTPVPPPIQEQHVPMPEAAPADSPAAVTQEAPVPTAPSSEAAASSSPVQPSAPENSGPAEQPSSEAPAVAIGSPS